MALYDKIKAKNADKKGLIYHIKASALSDTIAGSVYVSKVSNG